MPRYEFGYDKSVTVEVVGTFEIEFGDDHTFLLTREEMRELRSAIDDALNTSEDELGDVDF